MNAINAIEKKKKKKLPFVYSFILYVFLAVVCMQERKVCSCGCCSVSTHDETNKREKESHRLGVYYSLDSHPHVLS